MKVVFFGLAITVMVIVVVAADPGERKGFLTSIIHGIGWGVGREISHSVVRHIFH